MNGDKYPPEMEPETTTTTTEEEEEEEEEKEEEEEPTVLLQKTFPQHAQSSISSTDSDEMFNGDSEGLKFVIRDEQQQQQEQKLQGTGYSNGSSQFEIDGNHRVVYEVSPTDEIEAVSVTTRTTGAQNGTAIKFQRDPIPIAVANPPSKGEIEEQASYHISLDNGTAGHKRVEFRTENGSEVADLLYLERIYEKPSSHNFYCPNCQSCITKVIIRDREWVNNTVSKPTPTEVDKFRCTSCFSFLKPIGEWIFPKSVSPEPEEEVSSGLGNNVESTGIRERETFQVLQETRDHQQSQVDRAPVPDQSVDAGTLARPPLKATSDEEINVQEDTLYRKKGNNVENIGNKETETLQVLQKARDHQENQVDRAPVPDQSVDYSVTGKDEGDHAVTLARPSLKMTSDEGIIVLEKTLYSKKTVPDYQSVGNAVADQTQKIDCDVSNSMPTQVDSTVDTSVLDSAKDSKKGSTVENIVVGKPYTSHESNGSVLDVDNQTSTVNKVNVQNQSNGFAVLLESEIDTKVNSTPGLTSLEAMMAETVTDTLDGKKGIDVENAVVGIPYPSPEPKGGLLDRFCLPALINRSPVPDQSAGVVKTEIPKPPEPVEATVPDSSPVSPLGTPTAERVPDGAVGSRDVEAGPVAIAIDDPLDEQIEPEPSRFNRWEIVKCIVYGGLAESITSLGIVASAASANTATGNIVVLALANLISGLFILGHNLTGLKSEQFRRTSNETDEHERVDRYEVVLGNRENYILHFMLAIFSFILFGLVPPLVYGFSFTKSNDKDFKLAAVAGASLLCIILLAIGKAYIQRPYRWDVYVKTVATYIVLAAGAGGLSYLAGDLFDKLIKKYGWFEEQSPAFNLYMSLPEMSLAKPAWGSF